MERYGINRKRKSNPFEQAGNPRYARFLTRKKRHGNGLDLALGQLLREWLWRQLRTDFKAADVKTILPLINAARRLELLEQNETQQRRLTVDEQEEIAHQLFGELPELPSDSPDSPAGRQIPSDQNPETEQR